MHPLSSSVEPLEPRVAPAAVFLFTDTDGDSVKVTSSKGTNAQLAAAFTLSGGGSGHPTTIDLTLLAGGVHVFAGADLAVVATPSTFGDGFVHVGQINATGLDLGRLRIDGDLAKIVAGDPTQPASAIKALRVQSYGQLGTSTGAPDLGSTIDGALDALTVKGDFQVYLNIVDTSGGLRAHLGPTRIGGDLVYSGITAPDGFGAVTIRGSLVGGYLSSTGGGMSSLQVGGSILGGSGASQGIVHTIGDIGSIFVRHNIEGGAGNESGRIRAGNIASLTVGGSIIGGSGDDNITVLEHGQIVAIGKIGRAMIGGDLEGGAGHSTATILGNTGLGPVTIGGSILGSSGVESANLVNFGTTAGAIRVRHDLHNGPGGGSGTVSSVARVPLLQVGGSIDGTGGAGGLDLNFWNGLDRLVVKGDVEQTRVTSLGTAAGPGVPTLAFGSINIAGSVRRTLIAAGYAGTSAINSEVQIGTVIVGGDWLASSLSCGSEPGGDGFYGTADDNLIGSSLIGVGTIARIASIAIHGQVEGTWAFASDSFGFVAEQIVKIAIAGHNLPLIPGFASVADFHFVGSTGDVRYLEVTF